MVLILFFDVNDLEFFCMDSASFLPFQLPDDWSEALQEELKKPYLLSLKAFLEKERLLGKKIYPPEKEIFSSLYLTPFQKVSVVLIGQDPYHGEGQAHGLSFSVRKGINPPPSLKNIYKELHDDLGLPIPTHGCLEKWAKQGVLLLNATLTVEQSQPLSHHKKGWEEFTDACVLALLKNRKNLVFLLWGKNAQEKALKYSELLKKDHLVLQAAHPSPYSATNGFFGCRHFSQTNTYLQAHGKPIIDWMIDA